MLQSEFLSDSDRNNSDVKRSLDLADKIRPYWPVTVKVDCYDGEYGRGELNEPEKSRIYISGAAVYLEFQNLNILISYYDYHKKYSIMCQDLQLERIYATNYDIDQAKNLFQQPQNIGKLTTKKISDWCYFYYNVYNNVLNKVKENEKVRDEFLREISSYKIRWQKQDYNGQITRNGIKLSFTIEKSFISYHMDFSNEFQTDFQTFLKLSDNRLYK